MANSKNTGRPGRGMSLESSKQGPKTGKKAELGAKIKGLARAAGAFVGGHKKQTALVAVSLVMVLTGTLLVLALAMPLPGGSSSLLASSFAGGVASSVNGGTAPSGDDFDPALLVPTRLPKTEDAGKGYVEETLFLGDSNTERMLYYSDVTGVTVDNGFGVVGMGISAFTSQGCARFAGVNGNLTMPQVVQLMQPHRVMMTFGTNNVGMRLDTFISDYKKAVAAVKSACPYTDIIVGSIFPVDQYRQNTAITMERIDEMNEAMAQMCDEVGAKFLNWSEALLDEGTGYSQFASTIQDGVHLSRAGMAAIFDYFRTHSYSTRDRRPTPLATPPQRIAQQPGTIARDPQKQAGPIDWAKVDAAKTPVTVVFGVWDETNATSGGGSVSPGSVQVSPGGTSGAVTASPKAGYTFVGWSFGSGTSGGGGATTSITVNSAVEAGASLSVTAVFRQTGAASSSSSASSSTVSASSSGASSSGQGQSSQPGAPSSSQPVNPPLSSSQAPPASSHRHRLPRPRCPRLAARHRPPRLRPVCQSWFPRWSHPRRLQPNNANSTKSQ